MSTITERISSTIARVTGRPSRRALADDAAYFRRMYNLEVAATTDMAARLSECRALAVRVGGQNERTTSKLNRILQIGVNPYLASLLGSMAAVDGDDGDLCFIGPNGCQTHPGFAIGPDKECGIAWLRGWIMDSSAQENTPGLLAVGSMLAEHRDAPVVIADALATVYPNYELAAIAAKKGDPGWGDRHRDRLVRDLIHAFRAAQ